MDERFIQREAAEREERRRDPSFVIKTAALGLAGFGAAVFLSYGISRISFDDPLRSAFFFAGGLFLWLVLLLIQYFALSSFKVAVPLFLLQAGALLIFLREEATLMLLGAAGHLFLFLIDGFWKVRADIENLLKIRFMRTSLRGISPAVTGLIIFLTLYGVGFVDLSRFAVPARMVEATLRQAAPIVRGIFPGFSERMAMTDFLGALADERLPAGVPNRAEVRGVLVRELMGQLERLTRTRVTAGDTTSAFAERAINGGLRGVPESSRIYVLAAIGVLLFLALKGAAFFVNWLAVALGFLAYEFLLVFGFFYVVYENRSKEVIIMK